MVYKRTYAVGRSSYNAGLTVAPSKKLDDLTGMVPPKLDQDVDMWFAWLTQLFLTVCRWLLRENVPTRPSLTLEVHR